MNTYRDLTIPEAGSTSARAVLSRALRILLDDLRRLPVDLAPAGPSRQAFVAVRGAVAEVLRRDAGAMFSVLRRPTVGVLIRALRGAGSLASRGGSNVASEVDALSATLALELAALGVLPGRVATPAPGPVACLSQGFVLVPPADAQSLEFSAKTVTCAGGGAPRTIDLGGDDPALERSYVPIAGETCPETFLALYDNNPLALDEAHPDKDGNALDLGGREPEVWARTLREALALIEAHLPSLHGELALYVQQIVPVGYDDHAHLSASYQEAIGTLYLSLHPQPMTMAEALIHEFSHGKLNALFEADPVLHNAFSPLFSSPVRPDPRPLHGVLLAVHAFLPVARLYEKMTEAGHPFAGRPDFQRRFEAIKEKNREGAATVLDHGEFTPAGEALADEIRRWVAHFA